MWVQQKGLVPFLFIGFALYFLYDGAIGYRRSDERWNKYQELTAHTGGKTEEWEKFATAKGWKTTPPEHYMGPEKYAQQYWAAGLTALVGLSALTYWQVQRKRVIRNDAEGIYDPATRALVRYGEITRIDKTSWKSKGFAYVHYGTGRKITLDDAKYDPVALTTVLEETEGKVAPGVVMEAAAEK
jgi:hypothetical protein